MALSLTREQQFDALVSAAAEEAGITPADILGPRQTREFTEPRMVLYYVLTRDLGWRLADVGAAMGGRDHSTVHHGAQRTQRRIALRDSETLYLLATLRGTFATASELSDAATLLTIVTSLRETLLAANAVVDRLEAAALDTQAVGGGRKRKTVEAP